MIDIAKQQPLRVLTVGDTGPHITVALEQVERIREILSRHEIYHWVQPAAISFDGSPFITTIELGRSGDAERVQCLLDQVD